MHINAGGRLCQEKGGWREARDRIPSQVTPHIHIKTPHSKATGRYILTLSYLRFQLPPILFLFREATPSPRLPNLGLAQPPFSSPRLANDAGKISAQAQPLSVPHSYLA